MSEAITPGLAPAAVQSYSSETPAPLHAQRSDRRGSGRGPRRNRNSDDSSGNNSEFLEKVLFINRSAKVVKGGRRFSFSALVITGDRKGRLGLGLGKSTEVSEAIKKGGEASRQNMITLSLSGPTIPHECYSIFDGAKVLLRPASPGTGLIAGKTVRAVLETAGVKDALSKSLGSKNAANVAKATIAALVSLRQRAEVAARRGIKIGDQRD